MGEIIDSGAENGKIPEHQAKWQLE